jgi:hypothetical protein
MGWSALAGAIEESMKPTALLLFASLALVTAKRAGGQERDTLRHDEVLALHRLELRPYGGWAVVPNSVTGAFVGADVTFRFHRFFALGGDIAWYAPFNGAPGATPSYPLNETRGSADLDAYLVPWPARAHAGAAASAFEPYLLGGLGAVMSRPVSVVDPAHRRFGDDNTLVDLCLGLGARVFVGERVAVTLELRDLLYFEKIESGAVAAGLNGSLNSTTWYEPRSHFTNAVQLRLGASFFLGGG